MERCRVSKLLVQGEVDRTLAAVQRQKPARSLAHLAGEKQERTHPNAAGHNAPARETSGSAREGKPDGTAPTDATPIAARPKTAETAMLSARGSADELNALRESLAVEEETVETLSVAAIVYYVAGVIGYLARGGRALGLTIDYDLVVGLAIPVVAVLVLLAIRRARRRLRSEDEEAQTSLE